MNDPKIFSDFFEIYRNELQVKKIYRILENLREFFFLPEKNPTLGKKMLRKCLDTLVTISLYEGYSRFFSKKFQKNFLVDKNPTSSFKIGVFWLKKCSANFLKIL